MAGTGSLRRLLDVLEIEEDEARMALEAALAEHALLERRLNTLIEQQRSGRRLIASSAETGELTDRWAGIEQTRHAARHAVQLRPRVEGAQNLVAARREQYLAKRVERRQAEALIEQAEASEALEAGRRSQRQMDDWYLNRLHGQNLEEKSR